jgi:hypothetical protein
MAFALPPEVMATCNGFVYCMAKWAYLVTNGTFWMFLLLGFCAVLYITTQRLGGARAFGFASIVGLLGAIWLVTLQLMSWTWASAFILAGAIGIAVMLISDR